MAPIIRMIFPPTGHGCDWHQAQIMARRHASIFDEYQIQRGAVPVINCELREMEESK
jgi:hypothetical protein